MSDVGHLSLNLFKPFTRIYRYRGSLIADRTSFQTRLKISGAAVPAIDVDFRANLTGKRMENECQTWTICTGFPAQSQTWSCSLMIFFLRCDENKVAKTIQQKINTQGLDNQIKINLYIIYNIYLFLHLNSCNALGSWRRSGVLHRMNHNWQAFSLKHVESEERVKQLSFTTNNLYNSPV